MRDAREMDWGQVRVVVDDRGEEEDDNDVEVNI